MLFLISEVQAEKGIWLVNRVICVYLDTRAFTFNPRNVQWFRGGFVFEAHQLFYHSASGFKDLVGPVTRVRKKKKPETRNLKFETLDPADERWALAGEPGDPRVLGPKPFTLNPKNV